MIKSRKGVFLKTCFFKLAYSVSFARRLSSSFPDSVKFQLNGTGPYPGYSRDGLPLGVNGLGALRMDRDGRSCSISDVPEGKYELSATLESDGRPPEGNHYIADVRADVRSVLTQGFT
jgi:hypothetical protein